MIDLYAVIPINVFRRHVMANAFCNNTASSFVCSCQTGFLLGSDECVEINECVTENNYSADASCKDTVDYFIGSYDPGFRVNGENCIDHDECANVSHTCDYNASCSNSVVQIRMTRLNSGIGSRHNFFQSAIFYSNKVELTQ